MTVALPRRFHPFQLQDVAWLRKGSNLSTIELCASAAICGELPGATKVQFAVTTFGECWVGATAYDLKPSADLLRMVIASRGEAFQEAGSSCGNGGNLSNLRESFDAICAIHVTAADYHHPLHSTREFLHCRPRVFSLIAIM